MNDQILLSVCCATYNHAPYLRKALDSILMQKTNFVFEVLVGEDCSTDNSRDILKEYEQAYPGFFTMLYREHNLGATENFKDLYSRCQGKYVIVLETDDYWIDDNKLQIQVDYLESHPDVLAVSHPCVVVDRNNQETQVIYPEIKSGYYTLKDFRNNTLAGQTTSVMYRNYHRYSTYDSSLCSLEGDNVGPGDRRKNFMFAANGKVFSLGKVMSHYRFITDGGNSFSATSTLGPDQYVRYYREFVEYAYSNWDGNEEPVFTAEYVYIHAAVYAWRVHENGYTLRKIGSLWKCCRCRRKILINLGIYYIRAFFARH